MMREAVEKALAVALIALFVATVLTVTWQVIGRYLLENPSSATEEIARFLLIWLGTLSAAYAFARRMHVGVDLLSARMDVGARKLLTRLIWLICAGFALGVMVYGGLQLVNVTRTLGQTSAALALPMWAVYTVMPISGLMIAYFSLTDMATGTAAQGGTDPESADD